MNTDRQKEMRRYVMGFIICVIHTVLAFLVVFSGLPHTVAAWIIGLAAVSQIFVQLHYFLHIDLSEQSREDLQLILFSLLLLLIMIIGTVWVLGDLHDRMMVTSDQLIQGED